MVQVPKNKDFSIRVAYTFRKSLHYLIAGIIVFFLALFLVCRFSSPDNRSSFVENLGIGMVGSVLATFLTQIFERWLASADIRRNIIRSMNDLSTYAKDNIAKETDYDAHCHQLYMYYNNVLDSLLYLYSHSEISNEIKKRAFKVVLDSYTCVSIQTFQKDIADFENIFQMF